MEWIEDVFYGAVTKGVNVSLIRDSISHSQSAQPGASVLE